MTTKRFNRVGGYVYDGDKCISHFEDVSHRDDIVKLLNELHEENEQLRHDATILIQSNQDYRKENKQLKFQLDECRNHKLFSRRELEEENEQLKQQLRYCEKFRHTVYQEISKEMSKHD
jgi:superoxide dismutase